MNTLVMENVCKVYGEKIAVDKLNVTVESGTMFGMLGPNGSGKSSTLRMILGITRPDSGSIRVFGDNIGPESLRRIGYLPEERGLYKAHDSERSIGFLGPPARARP